MAHFPSSEEKRPMPLGSSVSLYSLQLQKVDHPHSFFSAQSPSPGPVLCPCLLAPPGEQEEIKKGWQRNGDLEEKINLVPKGAVWSLINGTVQ